MDKIPLGATYLGDNRCAFRVWAPFAGNVSVHIVAPEERQVHLKKRELGYYYGEIAGAGPGTRYFYLLDGQKERPDPASRSQPFGVHGPSEVVDPRTFVWTDLGWTGPEQRELIFYELHVGTFTPKGDFVSVIPYLGELRDLGVTAIELMPVGQFPGNRNWGYDGVYPFAAQNSYGGPDGLQLLVDACHGHGLAVYLDVVYNHLGPEGNYLSDFGPYFTDRYRTPWGMALNFDGPESDEVRRFFLENAVYWLRDLHMDGLRLDAIHAITDKSAFPFLEELAGIVHRQAEKLKRRIYIFAESDLNDPRVIRSAKNGGYGMDGQWSDDFHHALHSLLTGESAGYYKDFGRIEHLKKVLREGYAYTGEYSTFRQRRHGSKSGLAGAGQFVVFAQNHDQVGNRAFGERLTMLLSFQELKLAAGVTLLSPFLPLLFMGEEYAETAPFQYFTSHTDPALAKEVSEGRRREFAGFAWEGEIPDPQDEKTFQRSRLAHELSGQGHHRIMREFYRELLKIRRELPALAELSMKKLDVFACEQKRVLLVNRWSSGSMVCAIFSFNRNEIVIDLPILPGLWRKVLDAAGERWLGTGSKVPDLFVSAGEFQVTLPPWACVLLEREDRDSSRVSISS
jgi:maltooligosyltrehalose trehalohydrolase